MKCDKWQATMASIGSLPKPCNKKTYESERNATKNDLQMQGTKNRSPCKFQRIYPAIARRGLETGDI